VLRELRRGIYLEDAYRGGNVAAIATQRGTLLVDTPMLPTDARHWRQQLLDLKLGAAYGIVNTDYHPEHILGNAAFQPVRVFGHEASLKLIAKYDEATMEQMASAYRDESPSLAEELAQLRVADPEVCVGERMTLYLGDRDIELIFLSGHTPASLGVYLPAERILFAGDNIVNGEHPVMSQANSLAWLEALVRIQAMDIDLIVPGVGEPCGKEAIEPLYDYITEMRRRTEDLFEKGASRRECVDKVGMLEWFPASEHDAARMRRRRRENVERVYTEIRTASRRKKRH
jgi:cyclase